MIISHPPLHGVCPFDIQSHFKETHRGGALYGFRNMLLLLLLLAVSYSTTFGYPQFIGGIVYLICVLHIHIVCPPIDRMKQRGVE